MIGQIRREHDAPDVSGAGSTYYRLSEAAVRFCHLEPELVAHVSAVERTPAAKPPLVRKRRP